MTWQAIIAVILKAMVRNCNGSWELMLAESPVRKMGLQSVLLRTLGTLSKISVVPETSSVDLAFIDKDGKT